MTVTTKGGVVSEEWHRAVTATLAADKRDLEEQVEFLLSSNIEWQRLQAFQILKIKQQNRRATSPKG